MLCRLGIPRQLVELCSRTVVSLFQDSLCSSFLSHSPAPSVLISGELLSLEFQLVQAIEARLYNNCFCV